MSTDSDELDMKRLAETPHECVFFNVRKASRALAQIYEEEMQSSGLRGTQYSLLVAISGRGGEGIGALSLVLVTDRTTITRNLRPLIERGLVENVAGPDRRKRALRLTRKGRAVLKSAIPLWANAQERVLRELGRERFEVVKSFADDAVSMAQGN